MKVNAIFGPPGTGKTRALVEQAEAEERNALFLSYTRAAAAEATSRLDFPIRTSTIHSLAFNALQMSRAAVVDRKKLMEFGKTAGIPFKGTEDGSDEIQEGDEYAAVLSFANNKQVPIGEAYDLLQRPGTHPRFRLFVDSYRAWKDTFGYMDFDDMLLAMDKLDDKHIPRHPVIFLDEAQDCSNLQWAVFRRYAQKADRIYIAGDDDQAIYEWNGANPHGMIEFIEQHDGEQRVLNQSHRVPRRAHVKAMALIGGVKRRVKKAFAATSNVGKVTQFGDIWNIDMHRFANDGGGMILVRDRFKQDEIKRSLNRDMLAYDVLGGFSPWTSKVAQELKKGNRPDIPMHWREFYRQADLTQPVKITLSTIHQAKGREAPRVLIDLEMPTRALMDLHGNRDAEIRVWYVALTRTSNELILCGSNPLL